MKNGCEGLARETRSHVQQLRILYTCRKRRSTVPYKQASGAKRPPIPVAYSRRLRQNDIVYIGVESVNSK